MGKASKHKIQAAVRDQIVAALKSIPTYQVWKLPWRKLGRPQNASTGKSYSGLNILTLSLRALELGVEGGAWLTYKQAKACGGQVRKGEKSVKGIYYRNWTRNRGEDEEETIPMLTGFSVFHTSQCDDLNPELLHLVDPTEDVRAPDDDFTPSADLEELLLVCPVPLEIGGDVAAYNPKLDRIRMPRAERFEHQGDWWRTYLHELVHATGHTSRLDRAQSTRFGSRDYAFEELVAELGSAVLSMNFEVSQGETPGELAVEHARDHAAYISSWIRLLEHDAGALFDAWALALGASDWVELMLAKRAGGAGEVSAA